MIDMIKEKFSNLWKSLVIINLLLSILIIWNLYSQNVYFLELMKGKIPFVIASNTPQTAIVINPLTGSLILVDSFTFFGVLAIIIMAIVLAFWYKK